MSKQILVTGASGFVASHLFRHLRQEFPDAKLLGAIRGRSHCELIKDISGIELLEMHLEDEASIDLIIRSVRPSLLFHLAAQSFVPTSFRAPEQTMMVNGEGTRKLLEAIRTHAPLCRVLIAGSSEEYGFVAPEETPINEQQPLRPLSPYGVSKVIADYWGQYYARVHQMHVVITRGFNHEGPGRGEQFAPSNWARQAIRIILKKQDPVIRVGNLDAERDYTDVRDMVKGYVLALQHAKPGIPFNTCSGISHKMGSVLYLILKQAGLEDTVLIEREASRMRPADVPLLIGDNRAFRDCTGWKPEILFTQTIADMLEFWEEKENNVGV